MKCPVCKTLMKERHGKYGIFHSCHQHGTASIQGGKLFCTGDIYKATKTALEKISVNFVSAYQYRGEKPIDLEFVVRCKAASLGVYLDDLDLFVEGGEEAAMDEEDHWMNTPHR